MSTLASIAGLATIAVAAIAVAGTLLRPLIERRRAARAAASARQALAAARREAKPITPDTWAKLDGKTVGSASARLVEVTADELLGGQGLEAVLEGAQIAGNIYQTSWYWRCGEWRSESTRIDIPIDYERGAARPSAKATITVARQIYVWRLLQLKLDVDHEAELSNAMDRGRAAAYEATREALAAYCKRYGVSPDRAIRAFTGFNPDIAGQTVEATVEMLMPPMIAGLWQRLECHLPNESRPFDLGASPKKTKRRGRVTNDDIADEMPQWGSSEVSNG